MNPPGDSRVGTVLHAADLHLGSPLQSLGSRVDATAAESIRQLAIRAFDNLVALAIDNDVDAVVLAGDIYDNADRDVAAQLRFIKGLRRLVDAGITTFIAHGNHDPLAGNLQLAARIPEGVTVFPPGELEVHTVELAGGRALHIAGISYQTTHVDENLAQRFAQLTTPTNSTIGVLHTNVGAQTNHGNYAPCSADDLEAAPVGYWALGHIHQREVNALGHGRWWAYPGNLQGRHTKSSECGPKGALLVPVFDDGFGEPVFHACAEVRFERIDVDMSAAGDLEAALALAMDAIPDPTGGERTVVARLRLTGRTDAHRQLIDAAAYGLEPLAQQMLETDDRVVARIEVATAPPVDRSALIERGGILPAALERLDDVRAQISTSDSTLVVSPSLSSTRARLLTDLMLEDPDAAMQILQRAEQLLINEMEDVE